MSTRRDYIYGDITDQEAINRNGVNVGNWLNIQKSWKIGIAAFLNMKAAETALNMTKGSAK